MDNILIDDISVHLAASKNRNYRDRVRKRFTVFVGFLQDNGLTTRPLLDTNKTVEDDLKIMRSDLTDKGFDVVKAAYDQWLKGHDHGKSIDDITLLQNALMQI